MRTILVPTDFSEHAENALDLAVQLARTIDATIYLIHVVEAPTSQLFSTVGMAEINDMEQKFHLGLLKSVKRKMEVIVKKKEFRDIDLRYQVLTGNPFDNISEYIIDQEADLVVMGTRGCAGIEEILIGSNTEKVVRFASCPVISVPCPVHLNRLKRIVFATNLANSYEHIVAVLKDFQKMLGAKIELLWVHTLHVIENEELMREKLNTFAKDNSLSNYEVHVRRNITVEAGIMYFAEEVDADMIVMATHGRQGLSHIFSGSLAEDIVNHSKRAVLTVSLKAKD